MSNTTVPNSPSGSTIRSQVEQQTPQEHNQSPQEYQTQPGNANAAPVDWSLIQANIRAQELDLQRQSADARENVLRSIHQELVNRQNSINEQLISSRELINELEFIAPGQTRNSIELMVEQDYISFELRSIEFMMGSQSSLLSTQTRDYIEHHNRVIEAQGRRLAGAASASGADSASGAGADAGSASGADGASAPDYSSYMETLLRLQEEDNRNI